MPAPEGDKAAALFLGPGVQCVFAQRFGHLGYLLGRGLAGTDGFPLTGGKADGLPSTNADLPQTAIRQGVQRTGHRLG